jgi:hypothetical protein
VHVRSTLQHSCLFVDEPVDTKNMCSSFHGPKMTSMRQTFMHTFLSRYLLCNRTELVIFAIFPIICKNGHFDRKMGVGVAQGILKNLLKL